MLATRSSSAWTRSAKEPGPARSPSGAAVVPKDRRIYKVRDSKLLTEAERESMFDRIADWCEGWSIGMASHRECDELGMSAAQKLAARRALDGLGLHVDRVLLDGKWDFVGGRKITDDRTG